jgi:hypothetical protein
MTSPNVQEIRALARWAFEILELFWEIPTWAIKIRPAKGIVPAEYDRLLQALWTLGFNHEKGVLKISGDPEEIVHRAAEDIIWWREVKVMTLAYGLDVLRIVERSIADYSKRWPRLDFAVARGDFARLRDEGRRLLGPPPK